jgi:hypothetical protein
MRRQILTFIAILALMAGLAQSGLADYITVTDVDSSDDNKIWQLFPWGNNAITVHEFYNEKYLIPYPPNGGMAVVNASHQFFDTVVTPVKGAGNPKIYFSITNAHPPPFQVPPLPYIAYTWSDYHFEIYNSTFTTRLAILSSATSTQTPNLQTTTYTGPGSIYDGVNFGVPLAVAGGDVVFFTLNFTSDDPFGIRQVATTVPLPGAVWLLGGGLAGLLGFRGFRRRS